tara:strand:+ start:132 stop:296 length:165 start_codon:yes stop_codon:yes gene_type:complete
MEFINCWAEHSKAKFIMFSKAHIAVGLCLAQSPQQKHKETNKVVNQKTDQFLEK